MDMRVTLRPAPLQTATPDKAPAPSAPASDAPRAIGAPVPAPSHAKGFVDAATSTGLAFRVIDTDNGTVLMQLPSEQSIKLRAYREALERARAEARTTPGVVV